ncbi:MAG TPA: beta-phosphoglucomutase [Cyclobacteriaceae bacterium]|nr:beta-phosphoglucomutase [Cyclobacteriaceae bacterium]
MIKACIFDLDGVIVDTAHYHYLAWNRLANELGLNISEKENEQLKGVSRMRSLDIILGLGHITKTAAEKEVLATKKNGWFVDYINAMKPEEIFPGVRELIRELKTRGQKIGLASSSKNAMSVIRLLKINELFDAVVDGNMIVHSKPDPEIFLLAASKLKTPPGECLVFEDAVAGIEAAVAAGMKCIGIGSPSQLNKANRVISRTGDFNPDDLTTL